MTKPIPAILGGMPSFDQPLPFAQPTIEEPERITATVARVIESGRLTDGPLTRELEERSAAAFGVRHCVAVSSCTIGLMLLIQALEIDGPVLLPSFTFVATANAVAWNSLPITLADCSPSTWCLRPEDVHSEPRAIIGVHISGVPCDVVGLQRTADDLGAQLIYDSAHGAGSVVEIDGIQSPLGGFGRAEVFSLTPTKVMNGAEGGLVTTNDADLAERLRVARNYGNPGNYDTLFPGLNARLSELHAAVALSSLDHLEQRVEKRNSVAGLYEKLLQNVPGVSFQEVPTGNSSCYKDFTILVDEAAFGCSRNAVATALHAEGVDTRRYYSPPVHLQRAYKTDLPASLPVTEALARQVLSLPIWSHMPTEHVEKIAEAVARIQKHSLRVEVAAQSLAD